MQLPNILERKWEGLIAFLSADPGPTAAWRRRCLQTQDQRPPGGGAGRQGSLAMPEKQRTRVQFSRSWYSAGLFLKTNKAGLSLQRNQWTLFAFSGEI